MKQLSSSIIFQRLVAVLILVVSIASCVSIDKLGGNIWVPANISVSRTIIFFIVSSSIHTFAYWKRHDRLGSGDYSTTSSCKKYVTGRIEKPPIPLTHSITKLIR